MPAPFLQLKRIQPVVIGAAGDIDFGLDITIKLNGTDRVFSIGTFDDGNTSTLNPDGLEPFLGSRIVYPDNFLKDLYDNLIIESAINQNYDLNYGNNVLTIRAIQDDPSFNFGNVDGSLVNNPGGSQFNKVAVEVNTQASGTDSGTGITEQVAAPTVTASSFTLNDIYGPLTRLYPFGNLSDLQTIQIDLFLPRQIQSGESFAFYYNFLEKETDIYPRGIGSEPDFSLDPDIFFRNRATNDVQIFKGGIGSALSPDQGAKSFQTGDVVIQDQGPIANGHAYRILQTVRLTDFVLLENRNGNFFTYDVKYPKYVFRLDLTDDINPDNIIFSTNDRDLSQFFLDGSIGYFGEVLNTGKENFIKNSSLSTIPQVNIAQNTPFSVVIDSNNGNIDGNTTVFLRSQRIVSSNFERTKTFLENIEFSEIQFNAGGGSNNSVFTNVSSSFSGPQLTVNFDVIAGAIQDSYAIWIAVSNDNSTVNHNNVLVDINDPDTAADESVITAVTNPQTGKTNCTFLYHFQPDTESLANGFDVLNPFIEDRVVAIRTIANNDNVNTSVSSIQLQVRRTSNGQIMEGENFKITNPDNYIQARNYNVNQGDIRADITINKTTTGTSDFYDIVFPFQIWQRYFDNDGNGYDDVVFDVTMNCVQTINTGERISFVVIFRSTVFGQGIGIGVYDRTQNTQSEPQLEIREVRYGIEGSLTLDPNGLINDPFAKLVKGQDNRIQFIFEDNNLNDIIYSGSVLVGYVAVGSNDNINLYRQFHSVAGVPSENTTPWQPIPAEPNFAATITKIDTKTCMIEAVLVWDELINTVGSLNEYQISARIDRKDPPANFNITLTIEED